jgi:hypothetical protein
VIAFANVPSLSLSPKQLHARFLAILPRIETHARVYFRHVRCPERKEDCIAEVVALSWRWFIRCAEKGKDATQFPSALATYAARAVGTGRHVCGKENARDVLSPLAQQNHDFVVQKLPDFSTLSGTPAEEALHDNTRSEVPDQVAFRVDFPAWRNTLTDRDRRMADHLMVGERTQDVARRFGVSPGRVSQKRREFEYDWALFCDDLTADTPH